MATAYLSLGSNVSNRLRYLKGAIRKIKESHEIAVRKVSSVYETQPVGYENQGWFLNLVLEAETTFDPFPLLERLLAIEGQMGRKREEKWGPRKIDIDILLYDNRIVNSYRLTIPHPRMHQRRFVLIPLTQIAPKLLHPLLKKSLEELLESCEDKSIIKLYPEKYKFPLQLPGLPFIFIQPL